MKAALGIIFQLMLLPCADAASRPEPARPVAKVNGTPIHREDLDCAVEASMARDLSAFRSRSGRRGSTRSEENSERVLERLIEIELLYQESLKHRFPGINEEAEKRYQREVQRLGGEDQLESALRCNDISPEEFRKAIFRNVSINRLLDRTVYSRINVSEEEVRKYYENNQDSFRTPESVRLRQILVKAPREADDESWQHAREIAVSIFREAAEGEDFVSLVRRHSQDPSGALDGDMGVIHRGSLQGTFDSIIFTLGTGSVSEPLRSRHGFHIFQVVSTSPPSVKPLEEVRPEIITSIRRRRARKMISDLVADLREKARIEILEPAPQ